MQLLSTVAAALTLSGANAFSLPNPNTYQNQPSHQGLILPSEDRLVANGNGFGDDIQTSMRVASTASTPSQRRDFFNAIATSGIALTVGLGSEVEVASAESGMIPDPTGGLKKAKGLGGLPNKIRNIGGILDELQRDLMQERWDLVDTFPEQLRSYVPVFTKYTDAAFPSDAESDQGLRVALRYEVGRFFASVERLKQATSRKALDEAYFAFSKMSVHYDRYLHVGGLYTYYDATVSNEKYFKGISQDALVYANPAKDPPLVRDLIVITRGKDMGKTGIVIGIYPDGSSQTVVKYDRYKGLREIAILPSDLVAKRVGEQDPDDVFLIPRNGEKSYSVPKKSA